MAKSFLEVYQEEDALLQGTGKAIAYAKDEREQSETLIKLVEPLLSTLLGPGEEPLAVYTANVYFTNLTGSGSYKIHLFMTTSRLYTCHFEKHWGKLTPELQIVEYGDTELQEKKGLGGHQFRLVMQGRKPDDPPGTRKRVGGGISAQVLLSHRPSDRMLSSLSEHGAKVSLIASSPKQQAAEKPVAAKPVETEAAKLLTDLQRLHDQGVLNDEEFAAKKKEVLSRM